MHLSGGRMWLLAVRRGTGGVSPARCLSDYVYRMRMLDYYSQNDTAVTNEFPRSRFVVMLDRKSLVRMEDGDTRLVQLPYGDLRNRLSEWGFEPTMGNSVFLDLLPSDKTTMEGIAEYEGLFGTSLKTVALPEDSPVSIDRIRDEIGASFGGRFIDLRRAMLTMTDEAERNRLAKLQTLSRWSSLYRRCPKCASALRMRASKTAAECAPCRRYYYPTFSPVSITLVRNASDTHALLVRHRGSVAGVYTCVAGFALTGESLADCARREIAEEVGIEAHSVHSLGTSQPWPMPDSSLMVAHEAIADMDQPLQICPDELETAHWFSRSEIRASFERTKVDPTLKGLSRVPEERNHFKYIPPSGAIAHRIIEQWLNRGPSPIA